MTWQTPTLKETRRLTRDYVLAQLGARTIVPNSLLRIIADAMAGLAHMCLLYVDWLSKQLMPDTAEKEWLDRHGAIWLTNSDGSTGRKAATYAKGTVVIAGDNGTVIPQGTIMWTGDLQYSSDTIATIGSELEVTVAVTCLQAGVIGNLEVGEGLTIAVNGTGGAAIVLTMGGGADIETDDQLRERVLLRIRQPPMGGDANDYVAWALAVPGVTRAWASVEMGIGTVTVRFMMDELRAGQGGFPDGEDIALVTAYIDSQRPVTTKDRFVVAPVAYPISFTVKDLMTDSDATRAAIETSVRDMLFRSAAPAHQENGIQQEAQTIYAAWVSDAISNAEGVISFTLEMDDAVMPNNGNIATLGTIIFTNQ